MKITVITPSRLHMGIIDVNGSLGRLYGSIGCAINHPNIHLEVEYHRDLLISGKGIQRVRGLVERILDHFALDIGAKIEVKELIPEHVGLGSGTQLALAVGKALTKLANLEVTTQELAIVLGRGTVSGIGTAVFDKGGFIVDGGRRWGKEKRLWGAIPTIIRYPFPKDWLFVIVIPNVGRGLSGKEETEAFQHLPTTSPKGVGKICRLILMKMLPAVIEKDIQNFGEALTTIQTLVGDAFSHTQDGRFMNHTVSACVDWMLKNGAYGAGQSSWGPTVYGLVRGSSEAVRLVEGLQGFLQDRVESKVFFTSARNKGVQFTITENP